MSLINITADQAREISDTSDATVTKLLAGIEDLIREVAPVARSVEVSYIKGFSTHVSYCLPEFETFVPSKVSVRIVEELLRAGFSARFEAGQPCIPRGRTERHITHTLTIRW